MSDEKQDGGPCESHDVHLWPQTSRDGYAPTVHGVTEDAIGINVGGYVIVQPIRTWHAQAKSYGALEARCRELQEEVRYLRAYGNKDCTAMADAARASSELETICERCAGTGKINVYCDGVFNKTIDCDCPAAKISTETVAQPAPEVSNYLTHKGRRMSDSSLFDEICDDCGARDYSSGPDELTERACTPKKTGTKSAPQWNVCPHCRTEWIVSDGAMLPCPNVNCTASNRRVK